MPKYVYMMVSKDKYALPIATADSAAELGRKVGVNPSTIFTSAWRHEKGIAKRSYYIRVLIDEEGKEEYGD